MKTIEVNLGSAPNGAMVWGIAYDTYLVKDNTCGLMIEKKEIDRKLPATQSDEEYHLLVAKEMAKALEDKMIVPGYIVNYEFKCMNSIYRSTK